MDAYRTPDERFEDLPDFPWEPQYRDVGGLRMAHIDEGEGPPVVMIHGEPTWSFLWRKVLPPVRDAGYRVILPDLVGLRPLRQADRLRLVLLRAPRRLRRPLSSRISTCATPPSSCTTGAARSGCGWRSTTRTAIARMVVMDTGLFTGRQHMSDAWKMFRDFVERTEDLPISMLVRNACKTDPGDEVAAAYDAPFPEAARQAGRARVPADAAHHARRPRRRGRAAGARGPA